MRRPTPCISEAKFDTLEARAKQQQDDGLAAIRAGSLSDAASQCRALASTYTSMGNLIKPVSRTLAGNAYHAADALRKVAAGLDADDVSTAIDSLETAISEGDAIQIPDRDFCQRRLSRRHNATSSPSCPRR